MAHAAAELSELQNSASALSDLVQQRSSASSADGCCQRASRQRSVGQQESFIDATFAMAKGGGAEIGPTKRGKGLKIMAIVDRHGLPLSVSTHAANRHQVRLVQLCFDFYMIEAKPESLIGDRAYDSDPLDNDLRKDGIEMIAPHRSNRRKCATQDGRRLRRYARRWLVERFFAWEPNGNAASLSAGSFIRRTSSASCNSLASSSSSSDFEIGSSEWNTKLARRWRTNAPPSAKRLLNWLKNYPD